MAFQRIGFKRLPDGRVGKVFPFHMCMKGMESLVLCRDDEDYDLMVKYIFIVARRENVLIVIYSVVSNHCHAVLLAEDKMAADRFSYELKRMYSMWFSSKYGEKKVLRHTDISAIYLDTDWYVRNALAYVPGNAIDNMSNVAEYRWSGFRAMFAGKTAEKGRLIPVASLTKREKRAMFHSNDTLHGVPWLVDGNGDLDPGSACCTEYLEDAFRNDQSFFLKTIGALNVAEMDQKLVSWPRKMMPDKDFLAEMNGLSQKWFETGLNQLPRERKIRLMTYASRTYRTTPAQLARVLGLPREIVEIGLSSRAGGEV